MTDDKPKRTAEIWNHSMSGWPVKCKIVGIASFTFYTSTYKQALDVQAKWIDGFEVEELWDMLYGDLRRWVITKGCAPKEEYTYER